GVEELELVLVVVKIEIGAGEIGKFGPKPRRPKHIPLSWLEFTFLCMLEVPRLRFDKESVDHASVPIWKRAEIDAQANEREQVHCLARTEEVAVLEDAVSSPDFVEQLAGVRFEQLFAGVELVFDN